MSHSPRRSLFVSRRLSRDLAHRPPEAAPGSAVLTDAAAGVAPTERPRTIIGQTFGFVLATTLVTSLTLASQAEAIVHDRLPESLSSAPAAVPWRHEWPAASVSTPIAASPDTIATDGVERTADDVRRVDR